jgi:hypothetical protein
MCCNNMWFYIYMSHCEWAVCGYEGFLVLFSLLYIGLVRFIIRVKYMYFNLIINRTRPTYNNENKTKKPHIHTQPTHSETCLYKTTYCYSTSQHKVITSSSRQPLMMGAWLPETCWATIRREIKNTKKWHLVGFSYPHWNLTCVSAPYLTLLATYILHMYAMLLFRIPRKDEVRNFSTF